MDNINSAIEAARAAAASIVDDAGIIDLVANTPSGQTQTPNMASYVPAAKPSMASAKGLVGMRPDFWLKVDKASLTFKDVPNLLDEVIVSLDMTEERGFTVKSTIKTKGNPAQYYSTKDGMTCDKGGSWADAVRKVQAAFPDMAPFPSADLSMHLLEPVKDMKGKEIGNVPVGAKIGHTTSMTNFSDFNDLYDAVAAAGKMNTVVKVKLTQKTITTATNTWGVIIFTLVD
jgi:hypothetical protein